MYQVILSGVEAGYQAAELAANHAGEDWKQAARDLFEAFASKGEPFHAREARIYAEAAGLPLPPDNRSWGHIVKAAADRGDIKKVGYAPLTTPGSHGQPMYIWQWAKSNA